MHSSMLDGGRDGPFYDEIVDFFHYAQARLRATLAAHVRNIFLEIATSNRGSA